MNRNWFQSLCIELREAQVIAEQAQYGWKFDIGGALNLLRHIDDTMAGINDELIDDLPNTVVHKWATVEEPYTKSGTLKATVTKWTDQDVQGAFSKLEFIKFDLGSTQKVKDYLMGLGWKPTLWNFRKEDNERMSPKLKDSEGNFCNNLLQLDSDMAKKIVEYLQLKHRKGLVEGLLRVVRPDGRISGEAMTIGAATHRMTHKKIVNIPGCHAYLGTEIRSLFVAKEGYKIIGVDSKSNQLRMLCHYMGDDAYTEAVLNGDIHSENQRIAGLDTRAQAKTFIYGFLFGAGDGKIGKIVGGNSASGRQLRERFLGGLPKLKRLVNGVKARAEQNGYVFGLDGRKIFIDSPHKALNYLLQGAEAVYMKYAQCFLWKWIKDEGLDAHFVATVHDEFQIECKEEHVERVTELALKAMLVAGEHLNIKVPMEGDANIGSSWAETH